jgi:hypothetical protein
MLRAAAPQTLPEQPWGAGGGLPALSPELFRRWLELVGIAQPDARAIASFLSATHLCELDVEGLLEAMVGAGVDDAPQCVERIVEARARWWAAAQRGARTALHAAGKPLDLPLYYEWTPDQLRAQLRHVFRLEPGVQVRREWLLRRVKLALFACLQLLRVPSLLRQVTLLDADDDPVEGLWSGPMLTVRLHLGDFVQGVVVEPPLVRAPRCPIVCACRCCSRRPRAHPASLIPLGKPHSSAIGTCMKLLVGAARVSRVVLSSLGQASGGRTSHPCRCDPAL